MASKVCLWQEEDAYWKTGCGRAFLKESRKPSENGMRFCPYCGKPLREAKAEDSWGISGKAR